jgi:hypothetical protein
MNLFQTMIDIFNQNVKLVVFFVFISIFFIISPGLTVVFLIMALDMFNSFCVRAYGIFLPIDLTLIGAIFCGYFFGVWASIVIGVYVIPKKIIYPPIEKPHLIKIPIFALIGYISSLYFGLYLAFGLIIIRYVIEIIIYLIFSIIDFKRIYSMFVHCIYNIIGFSMIYNVITFFSQ